MKVGDVEGSFWYWLRWRIDTLGMDRSTAEIYRRIHMPTTEDRRRYGPENIMRARDDLNRRVRDEG